MDEQTKILVKEIYLSLQGEARFSGYPCVFIRLSGCPLRCRWCDTAYAFEGGEEYSIEQIVERLSEFVPVKTVEITGGEPLAQPGAIALIDTLCKAGYRTMIETSGSEDISSINSGCHIIMDLKCPDSKMESHNLYSNINHLKKTDEIKFVIASEEDFRWAQKITDEYDLFAKCNVLLSPAWGLMKPEKLASFMIGGKQSFQLNMQLHKYIWSPRAKGV